MMKKDIEICREQLAALKARPTDKIALNVLLEKLPGVLKTQEDAGIVQEAALDRIADRMRDSAMDFRIAAQAATGRNEQFLQGYAAALDSAARQIKALYELPF